MKTVLSMVVLWAGLAFANDDALEQAIAKAQGFSNTDTVRAATVKHTRKSWVVKWSLTVGEGGFDDCTSTYRLDGSLETLDCTLEYLSHSMGPENAKWVTHAVRQYDAQGTLTSVTGQVKATRLSDKKLKEKTAITKPDDEHLAELSKPMLKLDLSLQK